VPRALSLVILSCSPLIILAAITGCCWLINMLRVGFAGNRNPAPVVAFGLVLLLLHAGYMAAPWLYAADRKGLALLLMVPIGLGMLCFGAFFASRVDVLEALPDAGPMRLLGIAIGVLLLLLAYAGPIVVMLMSGPTRN
jgi:hypothetical protein